VYAQVYARGGVTNAGNARRGYSAGAGNKQQARCKHMMRASKVSVMLTQLDVCVYAGGDQAGRRANSRKARCSKVSHTNRCVCAGNAGNAAARRGCKHARQAMQLEMQQRPANLQRGGGPPQQLAHLASTTAAPAPAALLVSLLALCCCCTCVDCSCCCYC
jgi:hypothetical protein